MMCQSTVKLAAKHLLAYAVCYVPFIYAHMYGARILECTYRWHRWKLTASTAGSGEGGGFAVVMCVWQFGLHFKA